MVVLLEGVQVWMGDQSFPWGKERVFPGMLSNDNYSRISLVVIKPLRFSLDLGSIPGQRESGGGAPVTLGSHNYTHTCPKGIGVHLWL